MNFTTREMFEQDWDAVSAIYREALSSGIATFETVCPSFDVWDRTHLKVCRFVALADDHTVAGWCALSSTSTRWAYRGVVEESVYIAEAFQGMGLGALMLEHLLAESEKYGYWCIYAAVMASNAASIALHKKCGFREIGYRERIAKDRFGNWQNTVLFEKRNGIE